MIGAEYQFNFSLFQYNELRLGLSEANLPQGYAYICFSLGLLIVGRTLDSAYFEAIIYKGMHIWVL